MRTCYVALPVGIRPDTGGRMLDFDYLYAKVLQPTMEALGMQCRRLEEFASGTSWHRSLYTAIVTSDVMIADVSSHNPNVMYELGVRHALRQGRTLMISAGGSLPSNVGVIQPLFYEPDAAGRLTGQPAEVFSSRLRSLVELSQRTMICDSPLYEYFPDIEMLLPPELDSQSAWRGGKRAYRGTGSGTGAGTGSGTGSGIGIGTGSGTGSNVAQRAIASPEKMIKQVKRREEEVRSTGADPGEFLKLLRSYRDASAWDELIRLAVEAPTSIAQSPEVRQLHALALNRRGEPGDQDRAIALMEQLVQETGGDGESFGVLGRIYKDRHDAARSTGDSKAAAENLARALQSYGAGFEKDPKDYYNGVNVVTLLAARGDDAARGELATVLPRVRAAVQEKIDTGRPDFWDLATQLQLAALAEDWGEAERAASAVVAEASAAWMLESARRGLRALTERMADGAHQERFQKLDALLAGENAQADDA